MFIESPIVTKAEIVQDYASGAHRTAGAVLRTLKAKSAISPGLEALPRGSGGRVDGKLHLYCSLNRDAARAVRAANLELAEGLATEAGRVERSAPMKRIAAGLADAHATSLTEITRALSQPGFAADVTVLNERIAKTRIKFKLDVSILGGQIRLLEKAGAMIAFESAAMPFPVPTDMLGDRGVELRTGAPVTARFEKLFGEARFVVDPAVVIADDDDKVDSAADLYGTPWGEVLGDDSAAFALELMQSRPKSIKRPRVAITIDE